ncbi:nucleoside deaminase [Methanocella sp. MCL-LM]|uniref:nucleoside deaminase n=1 Tax=Methanocella sp. MCL-LM TaxID=3412035 RepID=UPI003C77C86D
MADEEYIRLAITKAREGISQGQLPFGAAIVRDGKVISVTHNTIYKDASILSHAETNAIIEACRKTGSLDLAGCTMYASCEPCPMCFAACVLANVSRIVFSARLGDGIIPGFSMLVITDSELKSTGHADIEVTGDILREEGIDLFREWRERAHIAGMGNSHSDNMGQ